MKKYNQLNRTTPLYLAAIGKVLILFGSKITATHKLMQQ